MALQSSSSASDPVPHHELERPVNDSAPRMPALPAIQSRRSAARRNGMDASHFQGEVRG
jgi:hypothetical protein